LRETKASLYVMKDTPMIVCLQKDIQSIIMGLG
jgi:chlorite dismutase